MHIDFSSAIDNARLIAARDEALRPHGEHTVAVQLKSSHWSALAQEVRSGSRRRPSSTPAPKAKPVAHHAH
ncbi:MAG: hypothetical protein PSW75_01405 [bacterium]|nr:hypothetical protein [bacterium]